MQTSVPAKPKGKGWKKELMSWVASLAVALVIVLAVRAFLFTIIGVVGDSMVDTLHNGDRLYVSVLTARTQGYERGDIVICYYPGADHACVKRVIALPGDTVETVRGDTYVNGALIDEPYIVNKGSRSSAEITLGEGEYFVMGDNRATSHDSRSADVGPVTAMVGKVRAIIWPPSRIGAADGD